MNMLNALNAYGVQQKESTAKPHPGWKAALL